MTYKQTIEFLYSQLPAYHRIGKAAYKANLENTLKLDEYFGHPHTCYRTIHVAGTNGKGSLSHMIASVLQEAGYRTGLYTSPHLRDFRERIRVNGEMIPRKAVTAFAGKNQGIIRSVNPSFFEMTVALAFEYFAMEKVDVAVIETGLGGRLDSTNIITPLLSVITNIGHDHMDLLGDTLQKVAVEKAGIIKEKVPVVIGESQQDLKDIFVSCARAKGSEIFFADESFRCSLDAAITISGERSYEVENVPENIRISGVIPLGGDYQVKNLQTLFMAYNVLKDYFKLSATNLAEGIRKTIINTGLKGRWQILGNNPLIVCDTGHNREGLEYVVRQIRSTRAAGVHIILGFVKDKDLSTILPLFPEDARYYFTRASVPRALDEKTLAETALEYGLRGNCYADVKKALRAARKNAPEEDFIFIGGSTFIVADVI